jgi:hypothetical protein
METQADSRWHTPDVGGEPLAAPWKKPMTRTRLATHGLDFSGARRIIPARHTCPTKPLA